MIDWVDFVAPLVHDEGQGSPFYAGEVMSTTPEGELDWGIYKRMQMVGSHSTMVQVRSDRMADGRQAVRVSGNLVKWFQGHNIFGTNDIRGLVIEALNKVMEIGKFSPSLNELETWSMGDIELLRVDCTESVDFGNEKRVLNALRSLDQSANLKFRGRGQFNGHSLLFGKGSRTWSLTLYSKGTELRKHKLPIALSDTLYKLSLMGCSEWNLDCFRCTLKNWDYLNSGRGAKIQNQWCIKTCFRTFKFQT
jgi:II/X family phage/plasmid replication protein